MRTAGLPWVYLGAPGNCIMRLSPGGCRAGVRVDDVPPFGGGNAPQLVWVRQKKQPFRLSFKACVKVDFQGSLVTSDAGLILVRGLDERLGFSPRTAVSSVHDFLRTGRWGGGPTEAA